MPNWLNPLAHDGLFGVLTAADRIILCAGAPASHAQATTAYPTGKMLAQAALDAEDFTKAAGSPDGRKLTVAAQTDDSADASGTANHIAFVDDAGDGALLGTFEVAEQVITLGNAVNFAAFTLTNREPTVAA